MIPITIPKGKFKAKALEYLRDVESSGKPIIITDHGKPTIEVRPYLNTERSPLDILKNSVKEYIDPDEPVGVDDWEILS